MFDPIRILYWALPVVIAVSLIEAAVLSRRPGAERYDWKSLGVNLFDQFGRFVLRGVPLSIAAPVFAFAWEHRLATLSIDPWWSFLGLFLGQEFCYYWYHRAAHRVRWFWATHAVHHTPNQLNLSAAYRLGWTGRLTGTTVFFTPLVWLGFRPEVVIAVLSLNLVYQFWIHATWIPKLGWLEYVLNTPSAHRVHHASNLRYLDANYGGVLIVFDRLFGTYIEERAEEPCVYGLVKPLHSYNPLRVEFDQWLSLARDLSGARSVQDVWNLLARPPGWRLDGRHETTEAMRARAGLLAGVQLPSTVSGSLRPAPGE